MQEPERKLTTASGRPYVENDNTMTVGPRGPVLLQDYILHENMAHFNRERIPERVVHAKGAGAYGTLTVTHDITSYTRAKLFQQATMLVGQHATAFPICWATQLWMANTRVLNLGSVPKVGTARDFRFLAVKPK